MAKRSRMVPLEAFKVTIDPRCSRIETLARLGVMTPQILTSQDVRELSDRVLEYISKKKLSNAGT